jgi:hypothetical protein
MMPPLIVETERGAIATESDNKYDRLMERDEPSIGAYEKPRVELLGSLHDMTLAHANNPLNPDGGHSYVSVPGYGKILFNGSF